MKKILMFALAGLLVVAFTVPAMAAAEWNFYGSARMSTFWYDQDAAYTGGIYDDQDLTWGLQGNSRIGAKVKAGDISGRFEYGTGINLRLLYGQWDFGGGSLLVGQTYTPVNAFYSNQVGGGDTDLLPYGGIYDGRHPMVQVKVGGFKFAAVNPGSDALDHDDVDTKIPKLEASYDLKAGPVSLKFLGGYNQYDTVDAITDNSYSITSWIAGAGIAFASGPFYVNGNVYWGQNLGPFGMWQEAAYDDPIFDGFEYQDAKTLGYLGVIGFKVSDTLCFEGGYAHIRSEADIFGITAEDTAQSYYVQAVITIAKGFFIVPEVGVFDNMDVDVGPITFDEGKETYFGLKWQINF
jgi:hypothetical protein